MSQIWIGDISLQICSDRRECFILINLVILGVGFCGAKIKKKTLNGACLNLEMAFAVTLCLLRRLCLFRCVHHLLVQSLDPSCSMSPPQPQTDNTLKARCLAQFASSSPLFCTHCSLYPLASMGTSLGHCHLLQGHFHYHMYAAKSHVLVSTPSLLPVPSALYSVALWMFLNDDLPPSP